MNSKQNEANFALGIKLIIFVLFCVSLWAFFPRKTITVPPGFAGVPVDSPWLWGDSGVRNESKAPGRYWEWKTTEYRMVPTTPLRQPVQIDDFTTSDNYRVDFSSVVNMRISDPVSVVSVWTLQFWSVSILSEYNAIARRAVKKYPLIDLMGSNDVLTEIDNEITAGLRAFIAMRKIPAVVDGVAMGQARPNTIVFNQIEETARVVQERLTYVERGKAEQERTKSETQRAIADKAYRNSMNISVEEFTTLQLMKMQTDACVKAAQCFIGVDKVATSKSR